jgi:hypothetical protein
MIKITSFPVIVAEVLEALIANKAADFIFVIPLLYA